MAAFKDSGNINHLSSLYQRYMDLVFGVCLKYFKEPERSKDAVMDIFDELNTKLQQHEVDNFKGWLHVLARNYCLMQLRSPRNMKTTEFNPGFMQSGQNTHLDNEVMEKEEDFKNTYKDPDEFCCLFVIDKEFTRFVFIPYPED